MSGAPRFRFRDAAGREHEIPSVEGLSGRIEAGDLTPDTSLYDAGTGEWRRAGDVPVFQFVVDELRLEGRLPESFDVRSALPEPAEPMKDPDDDDPVPATEEESDFEIGDAEEIRLEGEAPAIEELPLTPDPFEMHLPRTSRPSEPGEAEEASGGKGDEEKDEMPLHEWLMTSSEREVDDDPPPPPRPKEKGDPWAGVSRGSKGPWDSVRSERAGGRIEGIEPLATDPAGADAPGRSAPDEPEGEGAEGREPDTDGEIRSRPPPERTDGLGRSRTRRSERQRGLVIAFLLGGGGILALALLLMTGADATDQPDPLGAPLPRASTVDADRLPPFPLPSGAVEVPSDLSPEGMAVRVMDELEELLDALREEAGVPVVPPPGWLGGQYLSTATAFDEVAEFWEAYRDFVLGLAEADEQLYRNAATRAWRAVTGIADPTGSPAHSQALSDFLDRVSERYAEVGPIRGERFDRRVQVAGSALELHGFLVRSEDRIDYDPALGRTLSRDPILEAVPTDPDTRRELDRHLDRLFEALDQTRRGGLPALGGLRAELFQRLREPV